MPWAKAPTEIGAPFSISVKPYEPVVGLRGCGKWVIVTFGGGGYTAHQLDFVLFV